MPSVRCVNGLDGAVCSVLEAAGMPTVEHALAFVPSEQRADPRLEQVRAPSPATCSHHHTRSHRCTCCVRVRLMGIMRTLHGSAFSRTSGTGVSVSGALGFRESRREGRSKPFPGQGCAFV